MDIQEAVQELTWSSFAGSKTPPSSPISVSAPPFCLLPNEVFTILSSVFHPPSVPITPSERYRDEVLSVVVVLERFISVFEDMKSKFNAVF